MGDRDVRKPDSTGEASRPEVFWCIGLGGVVFLPSCVLPEQRGGGIHGCAADSSCERVH